MLTCSSVSRSEAIPEDIPPAGKGLRGERTETRGPPGLPTEAIAKSKSDKSFRGKEHVTLGPLHGAGAFKVLRQKVKFNFFACIGAGPVAA